MAPLHFCCLFAGYFGGVVELPAGVEPELEEEEPVDGSEEVDFVPEELVVDPEVLVVELVELLEAVVEALLVAVGVVGV